MVVVVVVVMMVVVVIDRSMIPAPLMSMSQSSRRRAALFCGACGKAVARAGVAQLERERLREFQVFDLCAYCLVKRNLTHPPFT